MDIEIIFEDADAPLNLDRLRQYIKGQPGITTVRLAKRDQTAMSVHDAIQFAVQHADSLAAIAAGVGAFIAALGRRASIEIRKDGTVVAKKLASEDAARIAEALKRQ